MSYEHETEAEFREAEARYESEWLIPHLRRTDPVYGMREVQFPQLMMQVPPSECSCDRCLTSRLRMDAPRREGLPTRREMYDTLKARSIELQRKAEPWSGEPYAPGDPYLLDRIESHRAEDGGFHRDY